MDTILIVVAIIIAIPFIVALFIKKEYSINSDIIIDRTRNEVFNYIKFLKNQDNYSKWIMTDPNVKKEFRGIDGTVGFVYGWNGNKQAGEGEQEIIDIKDGEMLNVEVRFKRPFENKAFTPMTTKSLGSDKTKVTWGMTGSSKYPMNLMTALFKGVLRKDLQISLNNLKNILENSKQPA